MIKLMAMENFIMLMETFMKESGATIKLKDMAYIIMPTAQNIRDSGKTICRKVKG